MDRKEEDVPIHAARSHLEEQRALVNSQLARVAKAVLHAQKMHGLAGCLGILLEKKFRLVRAVAARHTSLHRGTRLMRVGPFFFATARRGLSLKARTVAHASRVRSSCRSF